MFSNDLAIRPNKLYRKRPKWIARQAPTFQLRDRRDLLGSKKQSVIMSIPSFNDLLSPHESLNYTFWQKLSVKLKEPDNMDHVKKLVNACYSKFRPSQARNVRIYSYYNNKENMDQV